MAELTKTDIRKVRAVARDMDSVSFKVKKQVIEQYYYSFVSEKFQTEEGGEDGATGEQAMTAHDGHAGCGMIVI